MPNEEKTVEEKIRELGQNITLLIEGEIKKLETKRLEIVEATSNKLGLDQQQAELNKIKLDLERRERELQESIERNRQRTIILDTKEKKYEEKKQQLQTTIKNLNLE